MEEALNNEDGGDKYRRRRREGKIIERMSKIVISSHMIKYLLKFLKSCKSTHKYT